METKGQYITNATPLLVVPADVDDYFYSLFVQVEKGDLDALTAARQASAEMAARVDGALAGDMLADEDWLNDDWPELNVLDLARRWVKVRWAMREATPENGAEALRQEAAAERELERAVVAMEARELVEMEDSEEDDVF